MYRRWFFHSLTSRLPSVAFAVLAFVALWKPTLADEPKPRVLTDADLAAGQTPSVGDTVMLRDFTRCFPHSAIGTDSVKGKWWLRPYRTAANEGKMLCIEQRDKADPKTCIAPTLTYPVQLEGVYDIWVAVYRPIYGGGMDIKLTREKVFGTTDPWAEEPIEKWPPRDDQIDRLVEVFYKTADMAGQDIQLRQPKGTFRSFWLGMCNAHCAYVKLVRRAPAEVQQEAVALTQLERKGVVIDRDGSGHLWLWGTEDVDGFLQQIEQFDSRTVEALNWCIGDTFVANFPHPWGVRHPNNPSEGRIGDYRFERVMRSFSERNIDVLQVLVDRCHERGVKIYVSERTSSGGPSTTTKEHPEWNNKVGGFNYAEPGLRAFVRDYLLYIVENYDVDGLTVDFSRNRSNFNSGEEKPEYMTSLLRELREGLDRIGTMRNKRLILNASFVNKTWYEGRTPEEQGLDVQTWVNENIVDCIMPEGLDVLKFIEMCKGKKTKCYGRYSGFERFDGQGLQLDIYDTSAGQDGRDLSPFAQYGGVDMMKGTLDWYDAGAAGVFLFNFDAWTPPVHLPYPSLLREELVKGQRYGKRDGEKVEWGK